MLFAIGAVILFLLSVLIVIGGIISLADDTTIAGIGIGIGILLGVAGGWLQTHRIVPTQHVGVSRNTFSQDLDGLYSSGVVSKPFFGSVYSYPSSSAYERCEKYTPAIKGSYGITIDLCFYYDTGQVDWLAEINRTGSLEAGHIMDVWRNSVVGDVARAVKTYTPEELSDNRSKVEEDIFDNIQPWFNERGVPLTRVSFKNWDFTSSEVAKAFDESIVSQRKITEQNALFEAAKISRERETYEAETARIVAEKQKEALEELGFNGSNAVEYLWIKMLTEADAVPDVMIVGGEAPVSVPIK